jgi:hypothetical protein
VALREALLEFNVGAGRAQQRRRVGGRIEETDELPWLDAELAREVCCYFNRPLFAL